MKAFLFILIITSVCCCGFIEEGYNDINPADNISNLDFVPELSFSLRVDPDFNPVIILFMSPLFMLILSTIALLFFDKAGPCHWLQDM
jgi:hypothetical protein